MPVVRTTLDLMREDILRHMPGQQDMRKVLKAISASARAEWIALATDGLRSTARDYVEGIGQPKIEGKQASITLTGVLPNMVEQGWPITDLRTTVLRSPRAKTSKAGFKYMSVPFRHGTPGSGGRNVGRPMPKPIHNVAKNLAATSTQAAFGDIGIKLPGGRLTLASTPKRAKPAREILSSKEKEWHTTSIYTGMIREVAAYSIKKGQVVAQSSYKTFRTISTRNASILSRSWIHPGIEARALAVKVSTFVGSIAGRIIQDASK